MITPTTHHEIRRGCRSRDFFAGRNPTAAEATLRAFLMACDFVVVGTGVDPVTFRFSGGRSAN